CFTAWDLIVPLFLFVVGAVMPFSFARRLERRRSKSFLFFKILRRTVLLLVVGLACQASFTDFTSQTLRPFANTLQAFAVGYRIVVIVMLNDGIIGQVIFTVVKLVGYWALLRFVALGEHGAGSLEPNANVAYAVEQFVLRGFIDGTNPPYTWV